MCTCTRRNLRSRQFKVVTWQKTGDILACVCSDLQRSWRLVNSVCGEALFELAYSQCDRSCGWSLPCLPLWPAWHGPSTQTTPAVRSQKWPPSHWMHLALHHTATTACEPAPFSSCPAPYSNNCLWACPQFISPCSMPSAFERPPLHLLLFSFSFPAQIINIQCAPFHFQSHFLLFKAAWMVQASVSAELVSTSVRALALSCIHIHISLHASFWLTSLHSM